MNSVIILSRTGYVLSFVLGLWMAISGCSAEKDLNVAHPSDAKTSSMDTEHAVALPISIWDQIAALRKAQKRINVESRYFELEVRLEEKTPGILGGSDHVIHAPNGIGEIDLARYLTAKAGSFSLGIQLTPALSTKTYQVFFVSYHQKRKIEETTFGSGCDSFLDISSFFTNKILSNDFVAKTHNGQHAFLMAGTYVMSGFIRQDHYMAQLTIFDSRFPGTRCPVFL